MVAKWKEFIHNKKRPFLNDSFIKGMAMPVVDIRNIPTVVEFAPEHKVVEFTEENVTAEVVVGPTVVEFSWGELIPEPGLSGGGPFEGRVYIRPDIPTLPTNSEPVDPEADYIMLWDASSDTHVKVLAALGGGGGITEIPWATRAETDEGVLTDKALNPDVGAYAYDRFRHVGQHTAGKGTRTVELEDAETITINFRDSNVFCVTLGGNRTLAIDNPVDGQVIKLRIKQDGTGGRTLTWPANWRWVAGAEPTLSTGANAVDVVYAGYDENDGVWEASLLPDFTGTGTGYGSLPEGPSGPEGPPGPTGPTGPAGTPAGGLTGEVLTKASDTDYDVTWASLGSLGVDDLDDTDVTGVAGDDALVYDAGDSKWKPRSFTLSSLADMEDTFAPADGETIMWDATAAEWVSVPARRWTMGATWSNGEDALTTDANPVTVVIPENATIIGWYLTSQASAGSCTINIVKGTIAGYPPATAVCGASKPALSSARAASSTSLGSWTSTSLDAGDVVEFDLEAVSGLTTVQFVLLLERRL